MNVIKFDVEIKKRDKYWFQFWKKENGDAIKEIIKIEFKKQSSFEGEYQTALITTWNGLDHANVKNLNSPVFLLGYFTVNNTKVFLFELKSHGITGMNNIAIEIYAFGIQPIGDILNESFIKVRKILKNLDCTLVNKSIIYIYPYNSNEKDIESPNLKIKANLSSIISYKRKDYIRLALILLLSLISLICSLSLKEGNDYRVIFRALFGSGIFYIITDFIINILVPIISNRHQKNVTIDDLSSVIERTNEIEDLVETKTLEIPKV